MIRTLFTLLTGVAMTVWWGGAALLGALFGAREKPGGIFHKAMSNFAKGMNFAAGIKLVLHDDERILRDRGGVYVTNHVSWFDVFTMASILPRFTWVAKSELKKIPMFGRAADAAGIIFLERDNRKSAFGTYELAAKEVQRGVSIVVAPEGTRGTEYALRPFKKGPFVLAIAAQAPVVPVLVYGAREVMGKPGWRVKAGTVHVHFLEKVETKGMTYEDRGTLVDEVWRRMAVALEELYGIKSPVGGANPARRSA